MSKTQKFIEQMMMEIDPPSPRKPTEEAITFDIP